VRGFAGRAPELAALDAVRDPAAMVIATVVGGAGVGKTSLAVHWAHRAAADVPDGRLYANLRGYDPAGTPMDPAEAVRGLLSAFDVPVARIPVELAIAAARAARPAPRGPRRRAGGRRRAAGHADRG
jgi:hypothetical protein